MRKLISFVLVATFLLGCVPIRREAGYPGGNTGYLADRRVLFALGHEQRVNRYLISLTLLAPLIAESAETSTDAKLSADRINLMMHRLDKLSAAAEVCKLEDRSACALGTEKAADATTGIASSAYAFETLSYEVSRSLYQAIKQIYDNFGIKKRVSKFVALEPEAMLKAVFNLRRILPAAMKYYATYRDVAIIFSKSVLQTCQGEQYATHTPCKQLTTKYNGLLARPFTVDRELARLERPIGELFEAAENVIEAPVPSTGVNGAAVVSGFPWTMETAHKKALIYHIDRACFSLLKIQEQVLEGDALSDCRSSKSGSGSEAFIN